MKLIRTLFKLALAATAFIYALCLFNDITFFDYTVTEQGGILSIVGQELKLNSNAANAVLETYENAEAQAAEWLPAKLLSTVKSISRILNGS